MSVGIGPGQLSRVVAVEVAARAGVTAIIQPDGSIRDQMMIDTANRHRMAMLFTGRRHFKH